jgi:hypothetical protein
MRALGAKVPWRGGGKVDEEVEGTVLDDPPGDAPDPAATAEAELLAGPLLDRLRLLPHLADLLGCGTGARGRIPGAGPGGVHHELHHPRIALLVGKRAEPDGGATVVHLLLLDLHVIGAVGAEGDREVPGGLVEDQGHRHGEVAGHEGVLPLLRPAAPPRLQPGVLLLGCDPIGRIDVVGVAGRNRRQQEGQQHGTDRGSSHLDLLGLVRIGLPIAPRGRIRSAPPAAGTRPACHPLRPSASFDPLLPGRTT